MQAKSYVKGISMSPRRMRAVANTVRGAKVQEALNSLQFMPKRRLALSKRLSCRQRPMPKICLAAMSIWTVFESRLSLLMAVPSKSVGCRVRWAEPIASITEQATLLSS